MISLNAIYEKYLTNQCNTRLAVNDLLKAMYAYPGFFQLDSFSDEIRQDFMVFIHPHLYQIIDGFDSRRSSFATFFNYCLSNEKKRFFKQFYRHKARTEALTEYLEEEFQPNAADTDYHNQLFAPDSFITTSEYEIHSIKDIERYIPKFGINKHLSDTTKLLILTLKSCHYITDRQTEKIAELTGLSADQLQNLIDSAEKSLECRLKRIVHTKNKLNQTYISRKQLLWQLHATHDGTAFYHELQNDIKTLEQNLKKYTKEIKELPPATPSNKTIAQLLHISPTTVSHFVKQLREPQES